MKKSAIFITTLFIGFLSVKPTLAACPSTINDGDIDIIAGNTCVIPTDGIYILDKVVSETDTTNTAQLRINGGTLTVSNNATLRTGVLKPNGGNVIVQNGGTIIIGGATGTGVWVADSDADGYAANFTTYTASAAGRRRLGLMKSKTVPDCNDNSISTWQNLSGYFDGDGDGYGTGSLAQVCSGSSLPGNYRASAGDCDDSNGNIRTKNATGGTKSFISGYIVHTFTSSGTFTITCGGTTNVEYLVVAGGGSGGTSGGNPVQGGGGGGGGGGAGGVRSGTLSSLTQGTGYGVTVGAGGAARAGGQNLQGAQGGNSAFHTITSTGGGGGGNGFSWSISCTTVYQCNTASNGFSVPCTTGGSGGGGGFQSKPGCAGVAGQGNTGGYGSDYGGGGGGGGAGGGGGNAPSSWSGGAGGAGISSSITGSAVTYGVGGAGPDSNGNPNTIEITNGTANRGNGGSGGAGGSYSSGAGGSGVVIVRYANP